MGPKDAKEMANNVDPDQTAWSLIQVCIVCEDINGLLDYPENVGKLMAEVTGWVVA